MQTFTGAMPRGQGLIGQTNGLASKAIQMTPPQRPIMPSLVTPQNNSAAVKSQKIIHPDGTQVVHTYDTESKGPKKDTKSAPQSQFQIKFMNGMHHIPFRHSDGSIKFINANGEISQ